MMNRLNTGERLKKLLRALFINEFTVFGLVFLPVLAALMILVALSAFSVKDAWGYGFIAIIAGITFEFPYAKLCERFLK